METTLSEAKLQLSAIMEDLFLVLTPKEKEVVVKRFGLDSSPRQTLEKIGQGFSVTRERIRQIEKIALSKLRRTAENTKLAMVHKYGKEILNESGGISLEDSLLSQVLKRIDSTSKVDAFIAVLALTISPDFERVEKNLEFHPFWLVAPMSLEDVEAACSAAHSVLMKKKEVMAEEHVIGEAAEMLKSKGRPMKRESIMSALSVDKRFKKVPEGWGLMAWRHINPKSIRDKSYVVLKKGGEPLHFVEIANRILAAGFDKKQVTVQAVHNELIRNDMFVLAGRGLYALKEWGYRPGTVADIIEDLLRKKSPLTKQEIMNGVLKQRHVKKGTISLSLQKNAQFMRVGRALYSFDESKKVA